MALECFNWITQLLCGRCDDEEVLSCIRRLPDCLIIEILSRLPADSLLRSIPKTLISSRYFSTLHLKRARPLLMIHCGNYYFLDKEQKLFVFDEREMFMEVVIEDDFMINEAKKHQPRLRYSCEGVLVFSIVYSPPIYIIFNPTTREEVMVEHKFKHGCLCAFYYCSLTRQFKLVFERIENSLCRYFIYSLRTETRKKIHCPTPSLMTNNSSPAIVNGAVHFLVNRDTKKPNLTYMPHPGGSCSSWKIHYSMSLLVKDDCLSLCQLFIYKNRLDIWILEDYEARLWTKKCNVKLVFDNQGITKSTRLLCSCDYWGTIMNMSWIIKPLHFLDGELVFHWYYKGIFMYNMDHNTLRNIQGPEGSRPFTCYTYKKSLLTIA
ncbi:hypothetical protein R3W88_014047 [Solanum pinnatisectum]|uniref:F-box associated domain-containing protein n=1 Tax=Solanum pinnatisectum TaxID=50273 RepID=A0AAV9KQU9_9SOLN|nr:hypothetical protein R3W88_014047 [Solanum pinnatisectum]